MVKNRDVFVCIGIVAVVILVLGIILSITDSEVEADNGGKNVIECPNCHLKGYESHRNYRNTIQIMSIGTDYNHITCYCQECGNLWEEDL